MSEFNNQPAKHWQQPSLSGSLSTEEATDSHSTLVHQAQQATREARGHAISKSYPDGHWCGELRSNVTIESEYVFLKYCLDLSFEEDKEALVNHVIKAQRTDGSWGLAPKHPGDVSTSTEAYLALKILGADVNSQVMQKARTFILSKGGVSSVRIFTRIFLAMFGLFPWTAIPQLPPELVLVPASMPVSIYRFSSWARSTIVPLLVIVHHKPVFELPNGCSSNNEYLDEIWHNAEDKNVPYGPSYLSLLKKYDWMGLGSKIVDSWIYYHSILGIERFLPIRKLAIRKCMEWIFARQEPSGDWAGIFPSMFASIFAMHLEGIPRDDPRMVRGLEAIERFTIHDKAGKRVQACVSPVWDTVLMSIGLLDSHTEPNDESPIRSQIARSLNWVKDRQALGGEGDWRVFRPHINPGGFSFEYHNKWYPDIDDTAATLIAFVKEDAVSITSMCVRAAVEWVLGMQGSDGGFAAFDVDNNKLFLNKIPFSDMDSLCDPSTADVTGRVIEAFGLILSRSQEVAISKRPTELLARIGESSEKAIAYLLSEQEPDGSWYGRWGVNYIYGTSNVLCGLSYFLSQPEQDLSLDDSISRALSFLESWQNPDGGWGESTNSYKENKPCRSCQRSAFRAFAACESTPSQTAWALMALLAFRPAQHDVVESGIRYLITTQVQEDGDGTVADAKGRTWLETTYTGTGFPNHFMLGYDLYRHYFPMMALGRYLRKSTDQ